VSESKAAKEEAIISKKEQRLVADLERLRSSVEKGTIKKVSTVYERVGRLKERYGKVSQYYALDYAKNKDGNMVTEMKFSRQQHKDEETHGYYANETSHENLKPEEIWRLYMTLTRVESSFRSMKKNLGTRPIYHQLAHSTSSHLFISVLAYHLLASMEYRMRRKGITLSWKSAREILSSHQRQTVMMTNKEIESFTSELPELQKLIIGKYNMPSRSMSNSSA